MPSPASPPRTSALLLLWAFLLWALVPACVFVPDGKYVVTGPEVQELLARAPDERFGDVRVAEGVDLAVGDLDDILEGADPYSVVAAPVLFGAMFGVAAVSALLSQGLHFDGWAEVNPDTLVTLDGAPVAFRDLEPEVIGGSTEILLSDNYRLGERLRLAREGLSLGLAGGLSMIGLEFPGGLLPAGDFRADIAVYVIDQLGLLASFRIASGVSSGGRVEDLYGGVGLRGWILSTGIFSVGLEALVGVGATLPEGGAGAPDSVVGTRVMAGPTVELELTTNLGLTFAADAIVELTPRPRFGGAVFELGLSTYL